jgi:predicted GNAT family acetyltransferase
MTFETILDKLLEEKGVSLTSDGEKRMKALERDMDRGSADIEEAVGRIDEELRGRSIRARLDRREMEQLRKDLKKVYGHKLAA